MFGSTTNHKLPVRNITILQEYYKRHSVTCRATKCKCTYKLVLFKKYNIKKNFNLFIVCNVTARMFDTDLAQNNITFCVMFIHRIPRGCK